MLGLHTPVGEWGWFHSLILRPLLGLVGFFWFYARALSEWIALAFEWHRVWKQGVRGDWCLQVPMPLMDHQNLIVENLESSMNTS